MIEKTSIDLNQIHSQVFSKLTHNMNEHKFWRPFEDIIQDNDIHSENTESLVQTFTFDLNHQRSQPIGYLPYSPPKKLISSSTLLQHLCGNELSVPVIQSTGQQNWSKLRDRYNRIQPKPGYEENRSDVMMRGESKYKYKCGIDGCSKCFVYRSALESHRLVHSPERRFQCLQCSKRYKQLSGLYSHQSSKHCVKSQRFVCTHCNQSFVDYRNLRIHEYNQHSDLLLNNHDNFL